MPGIGHYWADRLGLMLGDCALQRSILPADRTIDVHFDQFMTDDLAMVARVYEVAHQPLDSSASDAMRRFVAEHPRGKFGAIDYDLAEFELDPVELRAFLKSGGETLTETWMFQYHPF